MKARALFERAVIGVPLFSARNMSLKSPSRSDRFEIGYAQALSVDAVDLRSPANMNPILDRLADTFAGALDLDGIFELLHPSAHASRAETWHP